MAEDIALRAAPSRPDAFMARYLLRHAWTGPMECKSPRRDLWGGRPGDLFVPPPRAATNLVFAEHARSDLASLVKSDVPAIGVKSSAPHPTSKTTCTASRVGGAPSRAWLVATVAIVALAALRRRHSSAVAGSGSRSRSSLGE